MGHTTGTSGSLEERVRETTLEGLHWSGRFCQVREIQQIQARGRSQLMAEAADGRDGWSARRGGSTIDVVGAGQMTAHLAGAGEGARDQAAILASVGKGPGRAVPQQGGFPSLTSPCVLPGVWVLGSLYMCAHLLARGCVSVHERLSATVRARLPPWDFASPGLMVCACVCASVCTPTRTCTCTPAKCPGPFLVGPCAPLCSRARALVECVGTSHCAMLCSLVGLYFFGFGVKGR